MLVKMRASKENGRAGHTLDMRTAPQAEALGLQASGVDGAQNLYSFRQMRTWSSLPHLPSTPFY